MIFVAGNLKRSRRIDFLNNIKYDTTFPALQCSMKQNNCIRLYCGRGRCTHTAILCTELIEMPFGCLCHKNYNSSTFVL